MPLTAPSFKTPVSVDNESEPAPASSDSVLEEDARVEEAYRKLEILAKIEPLLNGIFNRLKTIVRIGNSIKQIAGSIVARYLVTDQQMLRFMAGFIQHFDDDLLGLASLVIGRDSMCGIGYHALLPNILNLSTQLSISFAFLFCWAVPRFSRIS